MKNRCKAIITASLSMSAFLLLSVSQGLPIGGKADNAPDSFYPGWAAEARYNQPTPLEGWQPRIPNSTCAG